MFNFMKFLSLRIGLIAFLMTILLILVLYNFTRVGYPEPTFVNYMGMTKSQVIDYLCKTNVMNSDTVDIEVFSTNSITEALLTVDGMCNYAGKKVSINISDDINVDAKNYNISQAKSNPLITLSDCWQVQHTVGTGFCERGSSAVNIYFDSNDVVIRQEIEYLDNL